MMRPWFRRTSLTAARLRPGTIWSRSPSPYWPVVGSSRWTAAIWQSPSRSDSRPPSGPVLETASVKPVSPVRNLAAARSSAGSFDPITTMVRSISPRSLKSPTSTSLPA